MMVPMWAVAGAGVLIGALLYLSVIVMLTAVEMARKHHAIITKARDFLQEQIHMGELVHGSGVHKLVRDLSEVVGPPPPELDE